MNDRTSGTAFLEQSRRLLCDDYLHKIRRCLDAMEEGDLWWRPNPVSNSAGNLLLHLSGNVTQWIVHGVGGAPDRRRRQEEFSEHGGHGAEELYQVLHATVSKADAVLEQLKVEELGRRCRIQGLDVSVQQAVYHVVEHFSGHVGQLIYIAKLRTGRDLGLYGIRADGTVGRGWVV